MIAYGVTDEIFALASSTYERVGKWYMAGLIAFPVFCWTLGTFLGGAASTLLPEAIRSALGIAIYGMFLAIIIPPARSCAPCVSYCFYLVILKLSVCRYAGSCTCQLRVRHHYLYDRRICVWGMVLSG